MKTREEILGDVMVLLKKLADDWEYGGSITEDTYFFTEMGFESLDIVVLATSTQEHYRQVMPFPELFADLGERENQDISVREWVDFVHKHLNSGK